MNAEDGSVLEQHIWIDARPEIVFSFFTDPERMAAWTERGAGCTTSSDAVYRVQKYHVFVPNRRIVLICGWEGDDSPIPAGSLRVEVTLSEERRGTTLSLRHVPIPPSERFGNDRCENPPAA